ncbi:hypothetical protein [Kiloniella antarctica]|uniref:Uncharacterized protein n=1 Tax=Kiloniella antarctica TaxID=1550907 RepID=A0ABW5BIH4_9PROT
MNRQDANKTIFDLQVADMDYHFQTARRLRSAEAHNIFGKLFRRLASPFTNFKTNYYLALTRAA